MRKALRVFGFRDYRYLWASTAIAFTGMQMQQVARALLAWDLTHSYAAVGWVTLSFGLPMVLFALIGGAIADRLDKRNLTLATQIGVGALMFATAALLAIDMINIEWLIVLGLLQGTCFALGMPARTPLMAEAVGPENVMSAIAMSNAAMNMTRLVGPAVAGLVIGYAGMEAAYWLQAVLYAIAAATLLFVPGGRPNAFSKPAHLRGGMFTEIAEGLAYAWKQPTLRMLFAMLFVLSLAANPHIILLAGYVDRDLHAGAGAYGFLQAAAGAGALVGSLVVATFTDFDRKPLVQWICGMVGGAGLVLLTVASQAWGIEGTTVAVVLLGLSLTAYQTLNNTMLMDAAKPEYYGRMMSINMIAFSVMPLVAAPLGILADQIGAGTLFIAEGVVVIACMLVAGVARSRYTFGRTSEARWRVEARADAAAATYEHVRPPTPRVTASGSAAAHLHAPVAHAYPVPSGTRDGSGFPARTGAVQAPSQGARVASRAGVEEPAD